MAEKINIQTLWASFPPRTLFAITHLQKGSDMGRFQDIEH